jgi:chromosome segregation ATPase
VTLRQVRETMRAYYEETGMYPEDGPTDEFFYRADEVTTPVAGGYLVDRDPGDEHAESAGVYLTIVLTDDELAAIDAHFAGYVDYLGTPEDEQDELTRRAIIDALLLMMDRNRLLDDLDALDALYEEHLDALSADDADQIATLQAQLDEERARTAAQRRELDALEGDRDFWRQEFLRGYDDRLDQGTRIIELGDERDAYKRTLANAIERADANEAEVARLTGRLDTLTDVHIAVCRRHADLCGEIEDLRVRVAHQAANIRTLLG